MYLLTFLPHNAIKEESELLSSHSLVGLTSVDVGSKNKPDIPFAAQSQVRRDHLHLIICLACSFLFPTRSTIAYVSCSSDKRLPVLIWITLAVFVYFVLQSTERLCLHFATCMHTYIMHTFLHTHNIRTGMPSCTLHANKRTICKGNSDNKTLY